MTENVLKARNLIKIYQQRRVVNELSLQVGEGQIVGLLGPNGAGKTTTFRMITGAIWPDGGKIFLNGEDITELPFYKKARRGINYLPQEPSFFRKTTVRENLKLVMQNSLAKNSVNIEEEIKRLLDNLGVLEFKDQPASSLSGGEVRKVEIARALATYPSFILLDEPFSSIDPISVEEIQSIIYFLKEKGLGIIVTDHNVRETLSVTDYAYLMNRGEILLDGKPAHIIDDPAARKFYLGQKFRM